MITQPLGNRHDIRRLPLVDLIAAVVADGNRDALCEFHDHRTVFAYQDRKALRLAEFVACLRESAAGGRDGVVADEAYSLTIDRFSRLPNGQHGEEHGGNGLGIDCRNYLRPVLRALKDSQKSGAVFGTLGMDYVAAGLLQRLVSRHFHLSLREARRRMLPDMSRYTWQLPSGQVTVMMSTQISGRDRGAWLAHNVDNPDLSRPGERERIQAIIDKELGVRWFTHDDERDQASEASAVQIRPPWLDGGDQVIRLAEAVADEKADSIEEQRTTIRNLGQETLRKVIHEIFDALADGGLSNGDIARRVGLDKVTFSRFAGTRWGARTSVPDLWANTAQVLAHSPDFVAAARPSWVQAFLQGTSCAAGSHKSRRTCDDR